MKRFTWSNTVAMRILVVAALAASYGCASHPTAKDTVDSMSAFGSETAKAKDSVDNAVIALERLTASDAADIKSNLAAYGKAVDALEGQAKVVKANADKMKSTGDDFFKEWKGTEKVSPERQAQLTASYGKIKTDMVAARDAFTPFLASLKDVQGYLTMDPSVKGINAMGDLSKKARDNSVEVKSRLDAVLNQVNSVRGMLSTAK